MGKNVEEYVEILVHAAAPSRGKDDTRYRALASAYCGFQSVNMVRINGDFEDEDSPVLDEQAASQLQEELLGATPERTTSRVVRDEVFDDEDASYRSSQSQSQVLSQRIYLTRSARRKGVLIDSPQLSFKSVLDNAESPEIQRSGPSLETPPPSTRKARRPSVTGHKIVCSTPQSVVPDSQSPYDQVIPEFSSPTRILKLYLQHFDLSQSSAGSGREPHSRSESGCRIVIPTPPPLERSIILQTPDPKLSIQETPIILFSSPPQLCRQNIPPRNIQGGLPPSPGMVPNSRKRPLSNSSVNCQHRVPSPTTKSSPKPSPKLSPKPSTQRSPHQLSPQKRRKPSTSDLRSLTTPCKPQGILTLSRPPTTISQPTAHEIHPTSPPVSTASTLLPLITPQLQAIATELLLPLRYVPQTQTRPLRALERGYWGVSMADWDAKLRARSWKALGTFVGQGKAGWGVWCVACNFQTSGQFKGKRKERLKSESTVHSQVEKGEDKENADGAHGGEAEALPMELRIYCWGEVVGHVYLLLHLVTERKIKGAGARWIDADGEAVVVMPCRERSEGIETSQG